MTNFNKNISNLPFDITEHIAAYLNTKDLIECLCVSPVWNSIFRPARYRYVNLRYQLYDNFRPSFSIFLKTLEQSVKKSKRRKTVVPDTPRIHDLGSSIRNLTMEDGLMSVKTMDKLPTLCPNVNKVSFEWQLYPKSKINIKPTTKAFRSPHVFFEHFHPPSLTTLDLTGHLDGIPILDGYPSFSETVITALHYVPQLEYLSFGCLMISVTIPQVEEIHSCCPRLKGLKLHCPEGTPRNTNMINSPIDMTTITPALTMEKIHFPKKFWSHPQICELPWFKYIILKYPKLKELDIVSHVSVYIPDEGGSFDPSSTTANLVLKNHFKNLESIKIGFFGGKSSIAWPQLLKDIRDITLVESGMDNSSDWIKNNTLSEITRLSMPKLPNDLNTLRHFEYLRHLTLTRDSSDTRTFAYPELPVDIVLESCQALEALAAKDYIITCKQPSLSRDTEDRSLSSLKEMIMDMVIFEDNKVLTHVGERCPNLERLHLNKCDWINTNKTPFIRIHMPQNWLKTVYLREPAIRTTNTRTCSNNFRPKCISTYFSHKVSNSAKVTMYPLYTTVRKRMSPCAAVVEGGYATSGSNAEALIDCAYNDEGHKDDVPTCFTLDGFRDEYYNFYLTVLCCRGFGGIYYNEARLELDKEEYLDYFERKVILPLF
ncbi:hypothetical protein BDC45DRAFT_501527 [Circinella umbellata]|nr:hypothetical protein BDC45DRAFT_501527 [Circinella umbellata]